MIQSALSAGTIVFATTSYLSGLWYLEKQQDNTVPVFIATTLSVAALFLVFLLLNW